MVAQAEGLGNPLMRALSHAYERVAFLGTSQSLFGGLSLPGEGPPGLWDLLARLRSDLELAINVQDEKLTELVVKTLSGAEVARMSDAGDQLSSRINGFFGSSVWKVANDHVAGCETPSLLRVERRIVESAPWADGHRDPVAALDAFAAIAAFRRTVLLGPPGSGKSTILRALAAAQLGPMCAPPKPGNLDLVGVWPRYLPVFVEAKALVASDTFPRIGQLVTADAFDAYVKMDMLDSVAAAWQDLEEYLIRGQAVILIDGLDEIPVPDTPDGLQQRRRQILQMVQSIVVRYGECPFVISSRPSGYASWMLPGFEVIRLRPLGDREAAQIVANVEDLLGVVSAEVERGRLSSELNRVPKELREQPIFLTLLVLLFHEGRGSLPTSRGSLINDALRLLVGSWTEARLGGESIREILGCEQDEVLSRLETIAFRAHDELPSSEDGSANIDRGLILDELCELGVNPAAVLNFISSQAGVLISPAPRHYKFAHRLFQEFLAARHLAGKNPLAAELWRRMEMNPAQWREVGLLVGEILLGDRREGDLWDLVFDVFESGRASLTSGATTSGHFAMWFAAKLVIENSLQDRKTRIRQRYIDEIRSALPQSLRTLDLAPQERKDVGMALALLGDPRAGVGLMADGVPDIDWCVLPAGRHRIGTSRDAALMLASLASGTTWNVERETPDNSVLLPDTAIARYQVTVQQFRAFLDSPDGYEQDQWWSGDGLRWRLGNTPVQRGKQDLDTHPVTSVTLYEAEAFCAWYAAMTGTPTRLPTEVEWEACCRWGAETVFPWGDAPNALMLNVRETGIGTVVPVGCFPTLGPDRPDDMLGNVWEWCSSAVEHLDGRVFRYPYRRDDGREDVGSSTDWMRAVRGGYFRNPHLLARPGFRGRDLPTHRSTRLGFRLCFTP